MSRRKIALPGMKMLRALKRESGVSKGLIAAGLIMAVVGGITLAQKRKIGIPS